jgi:hypothetical protein
MSTNRDFMPAFFRLVSRVDSGTDPAAGNNIKPTFEMLRRLWEGIYSGTGGNEE